MVPKIENALSVYVLGGKVVKARRKKGRRLTRRKSFVCVREKEDERR
jgi:hypothetical protein